MRAVVLHNPGEPSVLEMSEVLLPKPRPGEVLIEVHACALNRLDIWVRRGLHHSRLQFPHILGSDIAGVVVEVGEGGTPSWIGREVVVAPGFSCGRCEPCLCGEDNLCPSYGIFGETCGGGYCEYICVPASNVFAKPAALTMVEAASVPLVMMTAWQMLVTRARIQPGDKVLIHAVGSGVGSAGLQIAKLFGARVVALASTQEKLEHAKTLGADACILSSDPKWPQHVRGLPWVGKRGMDVVFEHVGAATWDASIKLTRNGGVVVTCGATTGHEAVTDLRHVFFRQLQILGSTMASKATLFSILRLVEQGKLRPTVDRVFPLEQAREAHEYLDGRSQFGKVVLQIRNS